MLPSGMPTLGGMVLNFITIMIVVLVGVLLGGVMSGQITTLFQTFNLTGTVWHNLSTQAQTFISTALQVVLIGVLVVAFMTIIYFFAGRGKS